MGIKEFKKNIILTELAEIQKACSDLTDEEFIRSREEILKSVAICVEALETLTRNNN